tara:strand:- start:1315 stop:2040 length:726 start_codon:yes stop_codon:yes gene_type:complete
VIDNIYGYDVGVYDIESSFNRELNDIALKLYGNLQGTLEAGNIIGTSWNDAPQSLVGAHVFPYNRLHQFKWFPVNFSKAILETVNKYAENLQVKCDHPAELQFYIDRCWCTITYPGDNIKRHSHSSTGVFSMAYYSYWKENQGNFLISDNRTVESRFTPLRLHDSKSKTIIEAKESRFIIFPSHVLHETEDNNTDDIRISWSMDIQAIGFEGMLPNKELVNFLWEHWNNVEDQYKNILGEQ